jgi:hypothetical protein
MLFNVYLEEVLKKSEKLYQLTESRNLVAFADDLLIIAKNKEEVSEVFKEFEKLVDYGLQINTKKSQIITGIKNLEGTQEISGIKVTESMK